MVPGSFMVCMLLFVNYLPYRKKKMAYGAFNTFKNLNQNSINKEINYLQIPLTEKTISMFILET